jgi:prepilin-type N-terminal cleavage/methylation domain-containing protein
LLPIRAKGEKDMNEKKSRPMKKKSLKRIAGRMSPGLTLIEILIAIAILAIVAGIAYPSFQRLAINNYLKTAARDIASDFAQLKERSLSGDATLGGNRMHRLAINMGANAYQLQQCNNVGVPCGGWSTMQVKSLANYSADIIFDAGTNTLNYDFQPRGTASPGTIALRNGLGSTAEIRINITGKPRVLFNLQ